MGRESDTEVLWEDIYEFVDEAIEELPEKLRVALVAHFLEDETHESIARREGVSRAAITQRIQRGIEIIRRTLKRRGIPVTSSALGAMLATEKALAVPPSLSASLGKLAIVGMKSRGADAAAVGSHSLSLGGSTLMSKAVLLGVTLVLATVGVVAFLTINGRNVASPSDDTIAQEGIQDEVAPVSVPEPPRDEQVSTPTLFAAATVEEVEATDGSETRDEIAAADEADDGEEEALPEPMSVSGYVVSEDGFAIGGANVSIYSSESASLPVSLSALRQKSLQAHSHQTTADARGFFSFSNDLPKGPGIRLAASAPGYSTSRQSSIHANPDRTQYEAVLTLKVGINLYGEVRGPNGQPVPGAIVRSIGFMSDWGSSSINVERPVVADKQGRFLLGFDFPGLTVLEVRSDVLGGTLFADVLVGADQVIVLQWPDGGTLEGVIAGADQYGSGELTIALDGTFSIQSYDEDGRPAGSGTGGGTKYQARIVEDGRYRIEGISTVQSYKVHIRNGEGEKLTSHIPLDPFEEGKTQVFDYSLEQAVTMAGVVRGVLSGHLLRDVRVRWRSLDNPDLTDMIDVNDDGTYRLELHAPAGRYVVYPTFITHDLPEYQEAYGRTITIEPGMEHAVDLTFLDPVTRTVLVIDEFGEPIAEARVGYNEGNHSWGMGWETDETGRFTYHGVRPYEEVHLAVHVSSSGYKRGQSEAFAAEPGQVFEEEVVVLYLKEE